MSLPPDRSLEDVLVRIRNAYTNPRVGKILQAVLKDGPRAFKVATLLEIVDPKTRALHHYTLKLDSIDRRKAGWFARPERSILLDGTHPNEIERLYRFLAGFFEGGLSEQKGELRIIRSEDYRNLEKLLEALPNLASSDKLALVRAILAQIDPDSSHAGEFVTAFAATGAHTVQHIAVAACFVKYKRACDELAHLIEDEDAGESAFRTHLARNPWMFGSEYSELLDRQVWTRDDKLDFMLRRTVDGYLEIVEIKTPLRESLLRHDKSHDSYFPSSQLSTVLGQVMRYVAEVERDRDKIIARDRCDTLKIRARVIIGRDGDAEHQAALRNLNAHLHGIEVLTFDQLARIARRVLAVFEAEWKDEEVEEGMEDPLR